MEARSLARAGRISRSRGPLLAAIVGGVLLGLLSAPVPGQTQPQVLGQWSLLQPSEMAGVHVHMALVRGDDAPFHSRVVWWGAEAGHAGVLGWRADEAGCAGFPDPGLPNGNLVPIPFSNGPPAQNLF